MRDRLKAALTFGDRARDVMNTVAIMGKQAWLADCKASMFSAALCIGRITPIHLPTVLRDHIIHEMLLGAIGEALIDDGESWHMQRYRSKVIVESRAKARGKNLEGDAFDQFVADEVDGIMNLVQFSTDIRKLAAGATLQLSCTQQIQVDRFVSLYLTCNALQYSSAVV